MRQIAANVFPKCIHTFLEAVNAADSQRFLSAFATDALVNDVQRDFLGVEAIKKWSNREVTVGQVTLKVHQAFEHYGDYILEVLRRGNFDKTNLPAPLLITQHVSVPDDMLLN